MSEDQHVSGEQVSSAADSVAVATNDSAGSQQQEQYVPLSALQQERAQRQQQQEELRMIKDHLALLQSNQMRQQAQAQDEKGKMSKDDVITYGDLEQVLERKERQFKMTIEEMRMVQQYPDYQEVVTKYLPEVLKNNPALRHTLEQSQDFNLAYYLAKNSESYKSSAKTQQRNADAERIVKNANQSGSLSAIGGTSPINNAKRYKEMSDADFKKEMAKNLGYT